MSITVYTKLQCDPCGATKTMLDNKKVDYRTVDVTEDLDAYRFITDVLGYRQTQSSTSTRTPTGAGSGSTP